jgi:hypothetical protein
MEERKRVERCGSREMMVEVREREVDIRVSSSKNGNHPRYSFVPLDVFVKNRQISSYPRLSHPMQCSKREMNAEISPESNDDGDDGNEWR